MDKESLDRQADGWILFKSKENKSIEKKSYFEKPSIVLLMGVANTEWKTHTD